MQSGIPHSKPNYCLIALILFCITLPSQAQELEPLTYTNAPVDLHILAFGGGHTEGAVLPDASIPIENAFISTDAAVLAYVKPANFFGRSGRLGLVLPYAKIDATGELDGEALYRKVSGFGDPSFRLQVNFLGARALKLDEYTSYRQDAIFGFSLLVTAPLGQYDADKIVNVGSNRWSFRSELGFSKARGNWRWEVAASAKFFTNNDAYNGEQIRKQEPIYATQGHVTYYFNQRTWLSVGGTYYKGGRTTINSTEQNNLQSNTRFGATFSMNINRANALQIYANSGTSTRYGSDFDTIGVLWKHTLFPE